MTGPPVSRAGGTCDDDLAECRAPAQRQASREVEDRYGLTTTAPVGGTSTQETTRAEWRKYRPDAACVSRSWEEFTDRLGGERGAGPAPPSTAGEITGNAVALQPVGRDLDTGRQSGCFGLGKLAPDLTLPRLRQRWEQDAAGDGNGNGRHSDERGTKGPVADSAERRRGGACPT